MLRRRHCIVFDHAQSMVGPPLESTGASSMRTLPMRARASPRTSTDGATYPYALPQPIPPRTIPASTRQTRSRVRPSRSCWPITSVPEHAPSARFIAGDGGPVEITDSIIGTGGSVCSARIRRSVVSANVEIDDGSRIDEAVILPEVQIGRGSILRRVVIDKRCTLPPGFVAGIDSAFDRERFHVTPGGITLITQSMINRRAASHEVRREAA